MIDAVAFAINTIKNRLLECAIKVLIQLSRAMSPSTLRLELNEHRPTGHSQIREADAAHAMSSPFLYTICGRCISNDESK